MEQIYDTSDNGNIFKSVQNRLDVPSVDQLKYQGADENKCINFTKEQSQRHERTSSTD
jgi:hypothetical protein